MDDFTLIQFVFLFGLSIVFSTVSLSRETMISFLLAAISWIATGLVNFMLYPTGTLSMALSYICIALGAVFMLASLKVLGDSIMEKKQERFKVGL